MNANQTLEGFQLMDTGATFKAKICGMISDMPLFADLSWIDIE